MKISDEMLNDAGTVAKHAILSAVGVSANGEADREQCAAALRAAAGMALSICHDLRIAPIAFYHVLMSVDETNRAEQVVAFDRRGAGMSAAFLNLVRAARQAFLPHRRYRAQGSLVMCDTKDGASYIACRIAEPLMEDPHLLAVLLADALNANPDTRG